MTYKHYNLTDRQFIFLHKGSRNDSTFSSLFIECLVDSLFGRKVASQRAWQWLRRSRVGFDLPTSWKSSEKSNFLVNKLFFPSNLTRVQDFIRYGNHFIAEKSWDRSDAVVYVRSGSRRKPSLKFNLVINFNQTQSHNTDQHGSKPQSLHVSRDPSVRPDQIPHTTTGSISY